MEIHVGEGGELVLSKVYNGVVIPTDQGRFGIAQRDAGIEVLLDGVLVWSSSSEHLRTLNSAEAQALGVLIGDGWAGALQDFAVDQGWTGDEVVRFAAKLLRLGVTS